MPYLKIVFVFIGLANNEKLEINRMKQIHTETEKQRKKISIKFLIK